MPVLGPNSNKPIIGWNNVVQNAELGVSSQDANYPVVNLKNHSTASEWRATADSNQFVAIQPLNPQVIDYVGIARHNLGTIGATVSVSVTLASDPEQWVVVFEDSAFLDDSPAIIRFDSVEATAVLVEFGDTPTAPPRIAVLYAGQLTSVAGGIYQEVTPIPYSYQTDIVTGRAEGGDFLGRIVTDQRMQMNYEFAYVDYDWFHANMGAFIKDSMLNPFFFAWLPQKYPNEVAFGWLENDIRPIAERFSDTVVVRFGMEMGGIAV